MCIGKRRGMSARRIGADVDLEDERAVGEEQENVPKRKIRKTGPNQGVDEDKVER